MDKKNKNPNVPNLRFEKFNNNWSRTTISKVCVCNPKNEDKLDDEFIYIDLESVEKGVLKSKNIIHLKNAPSRAQRILYKNDILFQSVRPYQRNNYLLNEDDDFLQYVASTGYIQLRTTLNPYFLFQLLNTDEINNEVMLRCTGTSYPAINSNDFSNILITITNDRNEQNKIAKFFSLIEERIQTQIKIIDDYNSLKMGIYNWMFKENYADYKLKQLAYIVKGDQINNDQLLSNGSYYMMNGGTSPSGYLDSYNVSENTISISEGGNSCGYVQFNSSPFWSGGHCYTIQNVNSALIENKYLYHYLKHKEKEIMNLRIGTGLPNIQKKDLENFTIFVPSLLIQRKNLALFEMLDEKICILNEELERLEMQKKYLLRNMFI